LINFRTKQKGFSSLEKAVCCLMFMFAKRILKDLY
jgi:hypothetical protein